MWGTKSTIYLPKPQGLNLLLHSKTFLHLLSSSFISLLFFRFFSVIFWFNACVATFCVFDVTYDVKYHYAARGRAACGPCCRQASALADFLFYFYLSFCWYRAILGLKGLVPSCLHRFKTFLHVYFRWFEIFSNGYFILWVHNFFSWVFRGSKIFHCGFFVGLKFIFTQPRPHTNFIRLPLIAKRCAGDEVAIYGYFVCLLFFS